MALITINGTRTNVTATASDVSAVTNLDNLSDVNVENGLADNELLQYNYSASVWENTHEPVLETISQTISGTTLKQTQSGYETKMKLQTFNNTAGGGNVLSSLRLSGREDDGSGGDQFNTIANFYMTDEGGGDRGSLFYLVGDTTEFTSQDSLGAITPFTIQASRLLFPTSDNLEYDNTNQTWRMNALDAGNNNSQLFVGRDIQLTQYDDVPASGAQLAQIGIANDSSITINSNNEPITIEGDELRLGTNTSNNSVNIGNDLISLNNTTEIRSGSQNRTTFKSNNDGGEIDMFAFDSTGNDIFTGMHFRTNNNKKIFRLEARAPGGVDPGDNSYTSQFVMSGSNNSLLSKVHNESFAPFSFQASQITMETNNTSGILVLEDDVATVSVPLEVNIPGGGSPNISLNADMVAPDDIHQFYNSVMDYGTGSLIDHKHQFNFASRNDALGDQAVGAIRANYDSGDNNSMRMLARSHDLTSEASLKIDMENVAATVPVTNVNLSADPTPAYNGMQYYNDTTHKLRLYANGAWVDLN